jgi:biopolymer transport protein ExbD
MTHDDSLPPGAPPTAESVPPPFDPVAEAYGREEKPRKRRRKVVKIPGTDVTSLNLVPMMDVMTILLVFLIMSFATEPQNINVNLGLRPPESTATDVMEPAARVVVTADAILVEDAEVVRLADLKIQEGGQVEIPAVRDALLDRAEHLRALERMGGAPFDGKLLLVAHQTTPYSLITSVLFTAGQARFGEYKLVVMQQGANSE